MPGKQALNLSLAGSVTNLGERPSFTSIIGWRVTHGNDRGYGCSRNNSPHSASLTEPPAYRQTKKHRRYSRRIEAD